MPAKKILIACAVVMALSFVVYGGSLVRARWRSLTPEKLEEMENEAVKRHGSLSFF